MAIKVSTGMANRIADRAGYRSVVTTGRLQIYSGVQPTNADTASNGTLLCTITNAAGTFTAETLPVWTITLGGSAGSVDSIKIGGLELLGAAVPFTTDLTTTATALAAAITNSFTLVDYTATSTNEVVYISGPIGSGAALNAAVCAATSTTMSATVSNSGLPTTAGVTAVNGLQFTYPATGGAFAKNGTWSGLGVATGTAGWFRFLCDGSDAGTGASTTFARLDGSLTVAGGSGDATIDNTTISTGQQVTVTSFSMGINKG